jgi:hypothetical protein
MPDEICFICQRNPAGKEVPRYRFSVCRSCWEDSWVGWPESQELRILDHLAEHGIPVPTRNVQHLLPRG